ncbi:hypothetical protein GQ671_08425 [Salinicoccus hispanicus]|uniref:5,10-methylene-tetrahydrofolate dehydrogenase n=2 Tax=Salinicoccus hispanicus TaxID=157225 RepID=A0A6N8U0K7_9STAP|nr:hypothetical protein [Salinicoccus hispanicus]
MLEYYVSEEYEWEVEYYEDTLTGGTNDSARVFEEAINKGRSKSWDYVVILTDLPLFVDNRPIVAEVVCDENVALLSLPGLGLVPMHSRVREAILQLINEIYYGASDENREQAQARLEAQESSGFENLRNKDPKKLLGKRAFELLSPLDRQTFDDEDTYVDIRYTVKSKLNGMIRIVSGMVHANRPWEMFPAFFKIIVVAFTTGAYALIFPSVARLSEMYSTPRLILLTLIAISVLVAWIVLAHELWQKKTSEEEENEKKEHIRKMYNTSTIFTLLVTVIMYYAILFFMFLATTTLLIPPEKLAADLSETEVVGVENYLDMAWTVTTFATIIGAIGSVFENKEVILNSTYGYRQRQRHEAAKKQEEQEEEEAGKKEQK